MKRLCFHNLLSRFFNGLSEDVILNAVPAVHIKRHRSLAVDKNKPREAPARPTNTNSSSQAAAPAKVNSQNQLQPPPELVRILLFLLDPNSARQKKDTKSKSLEKTVSITLLDLISKRRHMDVSTHNILILSVYVCPQSIVDIVSIPVLPIAFLNLQSD